MRTFKIPNYTTGFGCDVANIAACVEVGVLPRGHGIFGSVKQWEDVAQYLPPTEGFGPKFWRDNATVWSDKDFYKYLRFARNSDGSYNSNQDIAEPTSTAYGQEVINFYNSYSPDFKIHPFFELVTYTREDAGRLNFDKNGFSDPVIVGHGTSNDSLEELKLSWPRNIATRFVTINGVLEVEAFAFMDYVKENPKKPAMPVRQLTDGELINAVQGILNSTMFLSEKAKALRTLLK